MSTNKTYGALLKTLLILRPPNKSHDVLTIKHEHMEDPTHALTQHHLKITWFIEPTACDVSSLTYDITQDGRIALSATRRGPIGNGIVSYLDYFGGHDPSGNWVEQVSSSSPERGYLLMFPE